MSGDSPTLLDGLVDGVEAFFAPLADAAADTGEGRAQLTVLLQAVGADVDEQDLDAVRSSLDSFVTAYEAVGDAAGDDSIEAVLTLLAASQDVVRAVESVPDAFAGVDPAAVVPDLLEYLAAVSLHRSSPHAYHVAVLLTVVEVDRPDTVDAAERYRMGLSPHTSAVEGAASLELDRLGDLLDAPVETLAEGYLPDGPVTDAELAQLEARVFPWIAAAAAELGLEVDVGDGATELAPPYDDPDVTLSRRLTLSKVVADGTRLSVTLALAVTADGLALMVGSRGESSLAESLGDWELAVSLTGETAPSLLDADGFEPLDPTADTEATASLSLAKTPDPDTGASFVLGPAEGTRLELGEVGVDGSLTAATDAVEADVTAAATDSAFVLDPSNSDGFIRDVLPEEGFTLDFDAGVGYAAGRGLYFEGGGGLDTDLPIQFSIGSVLEVPTLHLAAAPDPSGETVSIPVEVSASPQVQLGPVGATIEGIGLEAEITFPETNDGNLGPLDVDLGFKPPSGAGLSVDASAVVGGGYLNFDPENERYSGTLQLQIGSLTLKAVGLLTTQFPDGRDGFSLLVIITGEFPAMQLGFGFTLNGLGGLLGINRGTKVEALRSGLRDGTTKSILFPKDPMRNASRIVSDLRRVFPPTRARHVFGPMAKLGWGTPTIMTAEMGVLVSLPSPVKLVLLGRLHAALPDDDAALVVFNMDAVGVVDFGAKEASVDATLYDSRIVAYTLTGDMAMRTNWGDDPDFALSVGGFHPKFDPPEGFPELRRIALTLGPGNPRIRWSGYFAITSNTVQAGAKVELYAAAAGFSVSGHLGFDALFQFDPFKLLVDIAAGFAIKRGGTTLLSAQLKGSLKGPNPWHVRGKVSFSIWPLSFSVNVDAKFGERSEPEALPPADVLGEVTQALGDERNWSAQLPEGGDSVVTLREIERESGTVLAHPLGTLAVRQQVAPLGVTIDKFGNAKPATYQKFWVDSVSVAGQSQSVDGREAREQFAPAQFFELSDAEKLEGPSFERYQAGTRVGNALFAHGGMASENADQLRTAELVYETSVVDERASPFPMYWKRIAMPLTTATALTEVSAVARGPLRTTGTAKFAGIDEASGPTGVAASVSVSDTAYVVARASDLRRVAVPDVPSDGTTERETREALEDFVAADGRDAAAYRVVASHEAAGPEVRP